jgi:pimeloyl-ACP methyl ester carboxylesterase
MSTRGARLSRTTLAVVGGLLAGLAALVAWLRFGGPRLPAGIDAVIDRVAAGDLAGVVTGTTGETDASGIRIWYESIPPVGRERGTILLFISLGGDGILWPPSFLRALTGAGYRVIRFDQRGTGASDWMPGWSREHPYTLVDMARDAIAVLDATGTERAHLIGLSFGGMVAQEVAILEPRRVASLTLMSTSPDPTDPTLPEPRVGRLALLAIRSLPLLRYRLRGDPRSLVKERIAKIISVYGPEGVDVEENAALVLYDLRHRHGLNLRALRQHQAAVAATRPRAAALATLSVPTLVVHGTEDDLIPIEHARRLAALIPDAAHLWLDGAGHVFPYPASADVEGAILAHLDSAASDRGTDISSLQ